MTMYFQRGNFKFTFCIHVDEEISTKDQSSRVKVITITSICELRIILVIKWNKNIISNKDYTFATLSIMNKSYESNIAHKQLLFIITIYHVTKYLC